MTNRESSQRLFVAIELPDAWLAALGAYQDNLRNLLASIDKNARLRWVRPEGMHLTLKFIGEVSAGEAAAIQAALARGIVDRIGLKLEPESVRTFGVLFMGVTAPEDREAATRLVRRIDEVLLPLGQDRERYPVDAHVTLARIPPDFSRDLWREFATRPEFAHSQKLEPFDVNHVSLMRSHLGPGGARYERLATYPVGAPP